MDISKVKPSFNANRQTLGHIYPLDTPFTVFLDIADVCNFKCHYCFRSGQPAESNIYGKNELMSWETFTRAVDQLSEFPEQVKQISLSHNGESLCNKLLPKMLSYVHDAKLTGYTSIHTNASLLTRQLIDELAGSHLGRMVISLEGLTSEQYKKTCGIAVDFEKFVDNVTYLYKHKGSMTLNVKIIETALGNKTREEFFELFAPIADRVFVEQEVPLWSELNSGDADYPNKYGNKYKFQHVCPLVFNSLVVIASGDIYPCTHISPPLKGASVYKATLRNYWNSPERKNFLIEMLKNGRENISTCKQCYIPQNSIYTEEDIVDGFQDEILTRIYGKVEI